MISQFSSQNYDNIKKFPPELTLFLSLQISRTKTVKFDVPNSFFPKFFATHLRPLATYWLGTTNLEYLKKKNTLQYHCMEPCKCILIFKFNVNE